MRSRRDLRIGTDPEFDSPSRRATEVQNCRKMAAVALDGGDCPVLPGLE